jgi:hypothetical protein
LGINWTHDYILILGVLVSTIHKGGQKKNPKPSSEDKVQPKEADEVDEDSNYREFQND